MRSFVLRKTERQEAAFRNTRKLAMRGGAAYHAVFRRRQFSAGKGTCHMHPDAIILSVPSGFAPEVPTDVIRAGARKLIEQTIEAEPSVLLAAFSGEKLADGRSRTASRLRRTSPASITKRRAPGIVTSRWSCWPSPRRPSSVIMPMPRRPKRCAERNATSDPLVRAGSPPHRQPHGTAPDPTGSHHRMVTLATRPSGPCKTDSYQTKSPTVVIAIQSRSSTKKGRERIR